MQIRFLHNVENIYISDVAEIQIIVDFEFESKKALSVMLKLSHCRVIFSSVTRVWTSVLSSSVRRRKLERFSAEGCPKWLYSLYNYVDVKWLCK